MKKKKIEASKKIIIANYIIFVGVVIATFTALFLDKDLSSIITFDMGILGLVTAAQTYYFNKSKAENVLRMSKAYEIDDETVKRLLLDGCKEAGIINENTFNGGTF